MKTISDYWTSFHEGHSQSTNCLIEHSKLYSRHQERRQKSSVFSAIFILTLFWRSGLTTTLLVLSLVTFGVGGSFRCNDLRLTELCEKSLSQRSAESPTRTQGLLPVLRRLAQAPKSPSQGPEQSKRHEAPKSVSTEKRSWVRDCPKSRLLSEHFGFIPQDTLTRWDRKHRLTRK